MDGELWLSMMWGSRKAADLARDERVLVHSIVTARDGAEGEVKLRGTVEAVDDARDPAALCRAGQCRAWLVAGAGTVPPVPRGDRGGDRSSATTTPPVTSTSCCGRGVRSSSGAARRPPASASASRPVSCSSMRPGRQRRPSQTDALLGRDDRDQPDGDHRSCRAELHQHADADPDQHCAGGLPRRPALPSRASSARNTTPAPPTTNPTTGITKKPTTAPRPPAAGWSEALRPPLPSVRATRT